MGVDARYHLPNLVVHLPVSPLLIYQPIVKGHLWNQTSTGSNKGRKGRQEGKGASKQGFSMRSFMSSALSNDPSSMDDASWRSQEFGMSNWAVTAKIYLNRCWSLSRCTKGTKTGLHGS